ncbi:MAG TPA: oligopeptide/dipeptide ABC transporter ATP-binding protein [Acidimicrobiales bacterium]
MPEGAGAGTGAGDPTAPLVRVRDLAIHFPVGRAGFWGGERRVVHAVDGVSLELRAGETLGLVGESGSGKTTTGRAVLRRVDPTRGRIEFRSEDITELRGEALRRLRRHMQLVFQDPYASLNPRQRVADIVAEPLVVHGLARNTAQVRDRVVDLLEMCGLPADAADRYPHAFSGGQRQRVGIARALALEPELVVADEPVSALDVSIQAQVVNLMQDLQDELGLTYLFIAHDLSVVRHISDRVAIMYAGQLVEVAGKQAVYEAPAHPYTAALLSAVPIPDPSVQDGRRRIALTGEVPNPVEPPRGCRFASRCPYKQAERCGDEVPALREVAPGHQVACHWAEDITAGRIEPRSTGPALAIT